MFLPPEAEFHYQFEPCDIWKINSSFGGNCLKFEQEKNVCFGATFIVLDRSSSGEGKSFTYSQRIAISSNIPSYFNSDLCLPKKQQAYINSETGSKTFCFPAL